VGVNDPATTRRGVDGGFSCGALEPGAIANPIAREGFGVNIPRCVPATAENAAMLLGVMATGDAMKGPELVSRIPYAVRFALVAQLSFKRASGVKFPGKATGVQHEAGPCGCTIPVLLAELHGIDIIVPAEAAPASDGPARLSECRTRLYCSGAAAVFGRAQEMEGPP